MMETILKILRPLFYIFAGYCITYFAIDVISHKMEYKTNKSGGVINTKQYGKIYYTEYKMGNHWYTTYIIENRGIDNYQRNDNTVLAKN